MARAATKAAPAKKKTIRVDFTGVETASVVPEGEYIASISSGALEEGDKGEYIAWELAIVDGKYKGKKLYQNTSLTPQSLWATKRFLECAGLEVPDGTYDIDIEEMVDMQIGIVVEHDTYKGKTKSKIIDTFPAEGVEDEAAASEAAVELPTDEEIDEMGKADLKTLVEEHELDVELEGATSAQRRAVKKAMATKREEAVEPEKPTKGGKKKVTYVADDVLMMSEEELAEVIEKHDLAVKLDKLPSIRKQRAAVVDALEEAELLTE